MFDFWSRCTKQPGHDDLHGRSVSIEEEGKTRSRTRRRFVSASIDSIIVEVLSQLATLAFQISDLFPRREIIVRDRPYRNEERSIFLLDAHF